MSFVKSAALKADKGLSTGTTDIEAAMGRLGDAANGVLSATAAAGKRGVRGASGLVTRGVDGATGMLHAVAGHIERLGRKGARATRDLASNVGTVADDAARRGEGFTQGVAKDTRSVARSVASVGGACGCRGRRAGRKRYIGGGTRTRRCRGGRRRLRGGRRKRRGGRRTRRHGGRRTRRRGGRRTRRRGGRCTLRRRQR